MPRNHRDIAPEVKRAEIAAAALKRFLADGYESASVGKIAADVGVAQNTVYWYFKSKDELLAGALECMSASLYRQFTAMAHLPMLDRLTWLFDAASNHHCVFAILQWRLPHSEALQAWHAKWHDDCVAFFVGRLMSRGVSQASAALTATVGMFVAEGLVCHKMPAELRGQTIRWICDAAEGVQVLSADGTGAGAGACTPGADAGAAALLPATASTKLARFT